MELIFYSFIFKIINIFPSLILLEDTTFPASLLLVSICIVMVFYFCRHLIHYYKINFKFENIKLMSKDILIVLALALIPIAILYLLVLLLGSSSGLFDVINGQDVIEVLNYLDKKTWPLLVSVLIMIFVSGPIIGEYLYRVIFFDFFFDKNQVILGD